MKKEQCYGVIIVFKDNENLFLLLKQSEKISKGSWSFPKGHHEGIETPKETALREIREEAGVVDIEFLDTPLIREEYKFSTFAGEEYSKIVDYFIGFVKNKEVSIREGEIDMYKWLPYEEAYNTFSYNERKETLKKAKEYLDEYDSKK